MLEREPSRTAWMAANHRAAHQVLEHGAVFRDPLALTILGLDAETVAGDALAHPERRAMRAFIAARSAFAEARAEEAFEQRGARQVVVLGAGLDTFAYRNPLAGRLRVYEVDHPATQAWKRRRLAEAGVTAPDSLVYAPVDFERDGLVERLTAEGFDPNQRAVFLWLGVVPYLTGAAVRATLAAVAGLPGGAEIVFDYADPPETLSEQARAAHRARAERVAAIGEPWLSFFEPAVLHQALRDLGFALIGDLSPRDLAARYWPAVTAAMPERGGHVLWAAT